MLSTQCGAMHDSGDMGAKVSEAEHKLLMPWGAPLRLSTGAMHTLMWKTVERPPHFPARAQALFKVMHAGLLCGVLALLLRLGELSLCAPVQPPTPINQSSKYASACPLKAAAAGLGRVSLLHRKRVVRERGWGWGDARSQAIKWGRRRLKCCARRRGSAPNGCSPRGWKRNEKFKPRGTASPHVCSPKSNAWPALTPRA